MRGKWKYRGICSLLCLILFANGVSILQPEFKVYAEEEKTEEEKQKEEEERVRKELEQVYQIPAESDGLEGWPKGPGTYGEAAALMDMETGGILFQKQMNERFFPASITKILTALVVFQTDSLEETVSFVEEDVNFLEYGDASIGMRAGEEITMRDALYGMMLQSANEVSHGIIRTVGKKMGEGEDVKEEREEGKTKDTLDFERGVALMNETAKAVGAVNSHFVNSYGLHDENHYTTARDMCLIAKEAYQYEELRNIIQTMQHAIPPTNGCKESRTFQQVNKMIYPERTEYYEPCTGGKTGYTDEALSTLVTYAEKDGRKLVSVVLKTHGINVYPDTRHLMEYGFAQFENVGITNERLKNMEIQGLEPEALDVQEMKITLPKEWRNEEGFSAKLEKYNDSQGRVEIRYQGNLLGSAVCPYSENYLETLHREHTPQMRKGSPKRRSASHIWTDKGKEKTPKPYDRFRSYIGISGAILIVLLPVVFLRRKKKQRKPANHKG